jgi:hypothetical protein
MNRSTATEDKGQGSLKVIAAIGVITFLFLMLSSFGLKKGLAPDERQRVDNYRSHSDFDGNRAFALVQEFTDLGPRPSESEALKQARDLLVKAAREAGLSVQLESFERDGVNGANVIGKIPGNRPGVIMLATQFDTARIPDVEYLSANDGTADAALLVELARALRDWRYGRTLRFVWFDGTLGDAASTGPSHHLDALSKAGKLEEIDAVITLRMTGDCYLNLTTTDNSDEALEQIFYDTAARFGLRDHIHMAPVPPTTPGVGDVFADTGPKLLSLVDPQYGGSLLEHEKNYRAAGDSINKVCPQSLQAAGDVLYHAMQAIDGYLGGR